LRRRWNRQLDMFDAAAGRQIRSAIDAEFGKAATKAAGGEGAVVYSSAIPGKNWTGTPYQPIYNMLQDENQSRLFFGLLV
jgi:hypothetical protein